LSNSGAWELARAFDGGGYRGREGVERFAVDTRENWEELQLVVEKDFTLVGVNPALDQFKELAAQLTAEAEDLAREHGRSLAQNTSLKERTEA
jgi:hypothetical protein